MLRLLIVLFSLSLFAVSSAQARELPEGLVEMLSSSGEVNLYSIYPDPRPEGEQFLGYSVLGEVTLKPAEAAVALQAVLDGLQEADPADRQSCFSPRHALKKGEAKLLICFACHSVIYESQSGEKSNLAISSTGNEELAGAVLRHGLAWQGWQPLKGVMHHRSGLAVPVPAGYQAHGAAGTETLFLTSSREIVQTREMPGMVVLESPDGTEELASRWLDHSQSGSAMWYLTGLPSTFDEARNRRTFKGSAYELEHIKSQLLKSDEPARRPARIKIRPVEDEAALRRQMYRMQRDGLKPSIERIAGVEFLVARGTERGLLIENAAGLVETEQGSVLIIAEVPEGLENVLAVLVSSLQEDR